MQQAPPWRSFSEILQKYISASCGGGGRRHEAGRRRARAEAEASVWVRESAPPPNRPDSLFCHAGPAVAVRPVIRSRGELRRVVLGD